jgi:chorismate lyase/3-hydroxybenzoate synthase
MHETVARTGLRYAEAGEFDALLTECRGNVLGCLGFGVSAPMVAPGAFPCARIDMPTIGTDGLFEVWTSPLPVQTESRDRIRSARNAQVLFGCLEIADDGQAEYDALIYNDYCRIFDFLDELGYPNLLRIWHYLPDIHLDERQLERYKRFSLGRHEAFIAKGRSVSRDAPAASAVGTRAGNTVICFLAAPRPGTPIENPRQISAYSYPAQYGPRGPAFSRALFTTWNGLPQLYVSGTAAIFGHLSRHPGDAGAQADETIVNLRTVMSEARSHGLIDTSAGADMLFKVYLRRPEFRPIVETRLRQAFGAAPFVGYLQADICRRELLLEIEVVCSMRERD